MRLTSEVFFKDASHTLFRAKFLVSMVAAGHDDILCSNDLANEYDELKEKCETLERDDSKVEQESVELQKKFELFDSL